MSTIPVALSVDSVSKSVTLPTGERLQLLREVSVQFNAGSSTAIIGRSGSGKTTLLSLLGLLNRPDEGRVRVKERDTTMLRDRRLAQLRNSEIGFIFQNYSLIPHLTAWQNVELPLLLGPPIARNERRARVRLALELAQLSHRSDIVPRQLSGGEQQRAAVARALVRSPAVVLADEPTGALDADTADHLLDVLTSAVASQGVALIVATHDSSVAARLGTKLELCSGKVVEG